MRSKNARKTKRIRGGAASALKRSRDEIEGEIKEVKQKIKNHESVTRPIFSFMSPKPKTTNVASQNYLKELEKERSRLIEASALNRAGYKSKPIKSSS